MIKEKYGFVYLWRNKENKRYYIGSHWGYEDDGYICSSSWMKQAYLRKPENFKRRIIARIYTNRLDLLTEEFRWLSMIKDCEMTTGNTTQRSRMENVRYYNVLKKVKHWAADPLKAKTTGEKISATKKAKKLKMNFAPDRGAKISAAKKAKFAKNRELYGQSFKNGHSGNPKGYRKHTDEWKAKNSERMKKIWAERRA